ncbi:MAG: fluoride efflux transporter CrcB [Actinomycetota bacterium]
MNALAVAIAGALGALARYGLGGLIANRNTSAFPLETFVINVSGSFLLGLVFVVLTERFLPHPALRVSLTVGFLGAYTTFSTFSLETLRLIEDGAIGLAVANVALSVVAGLVSVYLGTIIGRAV